MGYAPLKDSYSEHSSIYKFQNPHCTLHAWPALARQNDFIQKCKLVRERLESRQTETLGKWMTVEAMKKSNRFSANSLKQIIAYCKKFPESLVRLLWHGTMLLMCMHAYIPASQKFEQNPSRNPSLTCRSKCIKEVAVRGQRGWVLCHHGRFIPGT